MKLKEGFILRDVAGETVVIPSGDEMDLNMMITLNDTGKFLWQKIEAGIEEDALVEAVLAEYDVSREDAQTHVAQFVAKLSEYGFLD